MIIRCTEKLLTEMGLNKSDLTVQAPEMNTLLGDWYANLFFIQRRKCLIFSNTKTSYSFVIFDIDRANIRKLNIVFKTGLIDALLNESIDIAAMERLSEELADIKFGKTLDKSVLGIMNEHVRGIKWIVEDQGRFNNIDASETTKQLNRTPLLTRKYVFAIEELGRVLGSRF